jgi:hypothetical protein
MLTHKQTYYLQTMGIEPWVIRRTESSVLMTVVMDAEIHDASQNKLFYAMFRSIDVSEDMLEVVYDLDESSFKKHIQKTKPRVIIALGCKVEACDTTPVIVMHHPSDLLQNPIDKKKAYADLGRVASCLMLDLNNNTQA